MECDTNKIPSPWQSAAAPYLPTEVEAFAKQGLENPQVLAYAAATVSIESSWNPNAVNESDGASPWASKGLAQIQGYENYQAIAKITGIDFVSDPNLMYNPYDSLTALAAFLKMNNMVPYIERGDYQSAAGIYNADDPKYRSSYTKKVAEQTESWLPVFS